MRCLGVWLGVTAIAVAAWFALVPDLATAPDAAAAGFEAVLVLACEAGLLACLTWAWLVAGLVVRDAARGRDVPRRGVPAWLARPLLLACGVALVGVVASPAQAGDGGGRGALAGLPLPDRATASALTSRVFVRELRAQHVDAEVTVRPGDTLWGLAESELGARADDGQVSARWRAVYRVNRTEIGSDPDLILPGQRLRMP